MRHLSLLLVLAGCVPMTPRHTIHEACSGPAGSRYRDYDQCYAEVSQARAAMMAERAERDRHGRELMRRGSDAMLRASGVGDGSLAGSPRVTTCRPYLGGQRCTDGVKVTVCRDYLGTIRCEEE